MRRMLSGAERWFLARNNPELADKAAKFRDSVQRQYGLADLSLEAASLEEPITQYTEAWNEDDLTPKLVDETWSAYWKAIAKEAQLDYELEIPPCDRYASELAVLRKQNRGVVLLPDAYMTDARLWAIMSPKHTLSKLPITNLSNQGGCIDVEMTESSPYLNHTPTEALVILFDQGKEAQRFPTYLAASHFRSLLTKGRSSFDKGTGSVLLGSHAPNADGSPRPLHVVRRSNGGLGIYAYSDVTSDTQHPSIGFRSEGRKK